MIQEHTIKVIAHIHNDLKQKFGVPRQSGLVDELSSVIIFEPVYRAPEAFRGLEDFTHLWLIWQFSKAVRAEWSPTVRPPRLGGNTRMGVFATRSPFRPNALGLSAVRLETIEMHPSFGPVLHVAGADLMDGTPIYDIKPYLAYADSHPEAAGGFTDRLGDRRLQVDFPTALFFKIPVSQQAALMGVLEQDPRPTYQQDPQRIYGFAFGELEIKFKVADGILTVMDVSHC